MDEGWEIFDIRYGGFCPVGYSSDRLIVFLMVKIQPSLSWKERGYRTTVRKAHAGNSVYKDGECKQPVVDDTIWGTIPCAEANKERPLWETHQLGRPLP